MFQLVDQVQHNDEVQEQHATPRRRNPLDDLVKFEGKQEAGRDDGEVRRPGEFEPQSDHFRQQQRRIRHAHQAHHENAVRLQRFHLQNQAVEDARVGIQMEGFQESGEEGGDIGMHQFEQAQAHDEEEQAFQDFEACNQHHAGVMLLRHYAFIVVRLLEHSVWASYRFVEESRSARCEKAEPTCVSVVYLSWSNAVSVWIPLRTHTSKQTYTKQPIIIPHETCLIFACEDWQKEGSLSSFWLRCTILMELSGSKKGRKEVKVEEPRDSIFLGIFVVSKQLLNGEKHHETRIDSSGIGRRFGYGLGKRGERRRQG